MTALLEHLIAYAGTWSAIVLLLVGALIYCWAMTKGTNDD